MNFPDIRPADRAAARFRPTAIQTIATATDTFPVSTPYGPGCYRALLMPEMDRRRMILTTGIGVLAAALPVPEARAYPPADRVPPPAAPSGQAGTYIFQDEFDGPAGSAPDRPSGRSRRPARSSRIRRIGSDPGTSGSIAMIAGTCSWTATPTWSCAPRKTAPRIYSGKVQSNWRGGVGHTWEARIKLNCLTAGAWPAYWLGNQDQGEIDVMEWYGNGSWPSATTVHAKANGGEWKTHNIAMDGAWHTWRTQWDDAGIRFWKDYTDGAPPYFDVPASSLPDWPFNGPGYASIRCSTSRLPVPVAAIPDRELSRGHAGRLDTRLVSGRSAERKGIVEQLSECHRRRLAESQHHVLAAELFELRQQRQLLIHLAGFLRVQRHLRGTLDIGGCASHLGTRVVQLCVHLAPYLGPVVSGHVPEVGVARDDTQHLWLGAADDDRRVRALKGFGLAQRILEVVELPVKSDRLLGPEPADHGQRLIDHRDSDAGAGKIDPIPAVFGLVPARADPEVESSTGNMVDGDRHIGDDRRIPIRHARDQATDPRPFSHHRHRGQRGPALIGRVGVLARPIEMVVIPHRLKPRRSAVRHSSSRTGKLNFTSNLTEIRT